jgi:hypothetical protein
VLAISNKRRVQLLQWFVHSTGAFHPISTSYLGIRDSIHRPGSSWRETFILGALALPFSALHIIQEMSIPTFCLVKHVGFAIDPAVRYSGADLRYMARTAANLSRLRVQCTPTHIGTLERCLIYLTLIIQGHCSVLPEQGPGSWTYCIGTHKSHPNVMKPAE